MSPKPGSSSELPPPKNLSQAPQLPQEQSVLIQSTPPPQPRTRPVPAPRGTRKAAPLPTQGGERLKNLELEFVSLDKRVCSQLEQFQKLVLDVVAAKENPVPKKCGQESILSEEIILREEAIISELAVRS